MRIGSCNELQVSDEGRRVKEARWFVLEADEEVDGLHV